MFQVFWGVFRVFLGCSWFSWECSGFLGGVPGFSVVPECSVMFRCSGVPVFHVPVILEVLHAEISCSISHFYRVGPSSFSREKLQDGVESFESILHWMQNDLR